MGVDVFFVISGFLITRLIRRELKESSFSFSGFYLRRIRRLMPAPPCVRVVVASNEALEDESKIHTVVQTASGRKGAESRRWNDVIGDHEIVGDR